MLNPHAFSIFVPAGANTTCSLFCIFDAVGGIVDGYLDCPYLWKCMYQNAFENETNPLQYNVGHYGYNNRRALTEGFLLPFAPFCSLLLPLAPFCYLILSRTVRRGTNFKVHTPYCARCACPRTSDQRSLACHTVILPD